MTRTGTWLLAAGTLLFIGVLASHGISAVMTTLSVAGWGLAAVALYHLLPLWIDAVAIRVLFTPHGGGGGSIRDALLARWAGESANSLMPGGQLGGPVLMARHLSLRGMRLQDAAAAITVSTTLQTFSQIAFALAGASLLGAHAENLSPLGLRTSSLIASGVLAMQVGGFYYLQRRGLFARLMRTANRFSGKRDWSQWLSHAEAIDQAVEHLYQRRGPLAASFGLSLVGWLVGTGEVYWILRLLGSAVGWGDALMLESLGQAIRGAAFAVPGALGVQEGGYLLLAPLAGLSPETALALSLAKRAREILLGVPGLVYLRFVEFG